MSEEQEKCHWCVRQGSFGVSLRAEATENTRSHPEVFTSDDASELDTQSETDEE